MNQIQNIEEPSEIEKIIFTINNMKGTCYDNYKDKRDYIVQKINEFSQAVTQNQPKVHTFIDEADYNSKKAPYIHKTGKKAGKFKSRRHEDEFHRQYHWTHADNLGNWWQAVLMEIPLKVEDLRKKLKEYSSEIETPFQKQVISPFLSDIKDLSPDEIKRFDKVFYEYMLENVIKQEPLIKDFLNGTFVLKEEEFIKHNTKTEIANIVLEAGSRMEQLKVEARRLKEAEKKKKETVH